MRKDGYNNLEQCYHLWEGNSDIFECLKCGARKIISKNKTEYIGSDDKLYLTKRHR